jgi:hypothetical protein
MLGEGTGQYGAVILLFPDTNPLMAAYRLYEHDLGSANLSILF